MERIFLVRGARAFRGKHGVVLLSAAAAGRRGASAERVELGVVLAAARGERLSAPARHPADQADRRLVSPRRAHRLDGQLGRSGLAHDRRGSELEIAEANPFQASFESPTGNSAETIAAATATATEDGAAL